MRSTGRGSVSRRRLSALLAVAAVLGYLATATQIAYPLAHWAAHSDPVHEQAIAHEREIFPCAVHNCNCRNALECRVHCCCFPKGMRDSHGHSGDDLAGHIRACGGPRDEAALVSLAPHLIAPLASVFFRPMASPLPDEAAPPLLEASPHPPLKVPIPA